jgi:hypothetical protein
MTSDMKKLFAICLLLCAFPVSAQGWVRYAENDDGMMYFDSLRTRKMGDTSFVWDLHNFSAPVKDQNGKTFQSALYAIEYNCRAQKRRILGSSRLSGAMGVGDTVSEETLVSEWRDAFPGSLAGELFRHICE